MGRAFAPMQPSALVPLAPSTAERQRATTLGPLRPMVPAPIACLVWVVLRANASWTVQVHRAWNVPPPPTCTRAVNVSSTTKARAIGRGLWMLVVRAHALVGMLDPTVSTRMPLRATEKVPSKIQAHASTALKGMPVHNASSPTDTRAQEKAPSKIQVHASTASMGTPAHNVNSQTGVPAMETAKRSVLASAIVMLGFTLTPTATRVLQIS